MKKIFYILALLLALSNLSFGQNNEKEKEFTTLNDALKSPEKVFRLNLSNQDISISSEQWLRFINLEYLNLKNDHLKEIPIAITKIKSLKTIDLSGNDFTILPEEFSNLTNLEEIYLNDEKNMNLPKTLSILAKLPKLKSLHLENDNLSKLPSEILLFKNLENLYLNQNNFKKIPEIQSLDHLKYLDLKDNNIKPELQDMKNLNFGFKINF
ncbi:MAG: leucine-rich repeat domain-containing protein [Flavobacterium sp.]|uniref:leucine-rich repeat domain-containing protein n=1 Tax=Flavobacterium sp. TaxID=239 RepID=UPI0022C45269|nr:leucine-rich repeat domain-containing protein [Flavobacterium sp.]MCZ8198230.1 leucine-rich repeat domain-containing protein [Flavobacterium sp.]